jgi:TetR/AcrR family fatty acid metabolism transcriptional regulator
MKDDSRKDKVILSATKLIAEKGYEQAKISDIAKEAGVASGLIYSRKFFINKVDLLLSIVLRFWITLNQQIEEQVSRDLTPNDKIFSIIGILYDILIQKEEGVYLAKVLNESLHLIFNIEKEDDEIINKRNCIREENRKLIHRVDSIILEGQNAGLFHRDFRAPVYRQVLYGSFQLLMYGLFLKETGAERDVGYEKDDVLNVMNKMVEKFLRK